MKSVMNRFLVFLLLATTLFGCSDKSKSNLSELEQQFATEVPVTDMNKSLQIAVETKETSFKVGSRIDITLYNKSRYYLYFDNDTHMRLLGSTDSVQWAPVINAITYFGPALILSPKGTTLLDIRHGAARPMIEPNDFNVSNADILLRIVVIGEVLENDVHTGKKVGAYVDVVLKP